MNVDFFPSIQEPINLYNSTSPFKTMHQLRHLHNYRWIGSLVQCLSARGFLTGGGVTPIHSTYESTLILGPFQLYIAHIFTTHSILSPASFHNSFELTCHLDHIFESTMCMEIVTSSQTSKFCCVGLKTNAFPCILCFFGITIYQQNNIH